MALIIAVFFALTFAFVPVATAEEGIENEVDVGSIALDVNLTSIVTLLTGDLLTVMILIVVIGAVIGMLANMGKRIGKT